MFFKRQIFVATAIGVIMLMSGFLVTANPQPQLTGFESILNISQISATPQFFFQQNLYLVSAIGEQTYWVQAFFLYTPTNMLSLFLNVNGIWVSSNMPNYIQVSFPANLTLQTYIGNNSQLYTALVYNGATALVLKWNNFTSIDSTYSFTNQIIKDGKGYVGNEMIFETPNLKGLATAEKYINGKWVPATKLGLVDNLGDQSTVYYSSSMEHTSSLTFSIIKGIAYFCPNYANNSAYTGIIIK